MKFIILISFCLLSVTASAQKMPAYGLDKVRIAQSDQNIVAELDHESSTISVKANLQYYWYSANMIHDTQGGYSGRLLNGLYSVFYLNKNLKEQGNFKKGLKDGTWKTWKEDGSLSATAIWERGVEIKGKKPSIWKRLPLLHKKAKTADSLNKSKEVKQ